MEDNKRKTLKERSLYLWDTGSLSDVTFVVGQSDKKMTLKAHKLMLAAASEVFETMFYGSLPETSDTISIPDLNPEGFEKMLRYVYLEDHSIETCELALSTLQVAHKYRLRHLQELCGWSAMNTITVDNVCTVLEAACLYDLVKLQKAAMCCINRNTQQVLSSTGFLNAQEKTVLGILKQRYLNITEDKLIQAVVKWAEQQCNEARPKTWQNIRQIMTPLLPHLRLTALTAKQFTFISLESKILTEGESLSVLMNIAEPGSKQLPSWCSTLLNRQQFPSLDPINIPDVRIRPSPSCTHEPVGTYFVKTKFKISTYYGILDRLILKDWDVLCDLENFINDTTVGNGSIHPNHESCSCGNTYLSIPGELVIRNVSDNFEFLHSVKPNLIKQGNIRRLEVGLPCPLLCDEDEIYEISLQLKGKGHTASPTIETEDVVIENDYISFYKYKMQISEENHYFDKIKMIFIQK